MIAVCKALKAHGVKGDIKVECYTDSPNVLTQIKFFHSEGKKYEAERVKPFGNFALIKLCGVNDMTAAETFRNKVFSVPKEAMPVPDDGVYYIDDLIGMTVSDEAGNKIGKISEVLQYGSADVLVLRENGKTIMFPHLKKVLLCVDVTGKSMTVKREEFDKVAVYED